MAMGKAAPRRAGQLASLATVLAMLATGVAGQCPYPLGNFIRDGDFHAYDTGTGDSEWQIIDAVRVRPQYSFGQIGYDGATLHFAYESEAGYFPPNSTVESETHIIAYKEYSQTTGWNVTREWISSPNISVKVPSGRHTQATLSVSGTDVWVAWQVSGWTLGGEWWPETGNFILYRAKVNDTWGDIKALSPFVTGTSSRLPKGVALADGAYVAYQTNEGEVDSSSFRIVGRTVSAAGLGPVEDISVGADAFSDETVQLVSHGTSVIAVWSSRNATEFGGEGEWQVWAARRDASGAWGLPVAVSERGKVANMNPTAAFLGDDLYVAWSTNDRAVSPAGDRSIVMRKVDLQTSAVGGVIQVTDASFAGYEDQPALIGWAGELHILWVSSSTHDRPFVVTNDTDTHWRRWDGSSLAPVELVSPPWDKTFDEFNPAFVVVNDALHATFIMDVNTPATGKAHDQRQMTKLLVRPPQAYDGYWAEYRPDSNSFVGNGTVNLTVRFHFDSGFLLGVTVDSPYGLVLANGSQIEVSGNAGTPVELPYSNGTFEPPVSATYCGKPIGLVALPAKGQGGSGGQEWPVFLGGGLLILAVAAAALLQRDRRARKGSE